MEKYRNNFATSRKFKILEPNYSTDQLDYIDKSLYDDAKIFDEANKIFLILFQ